MTAIPDTTAGDEILATWGQAVADWINDHTTTIAAANAVTNTQEQVVGVTIAANTAAAGRTYRITAGGTITSSAANDVTFRIRCGSTTLTGNIAATRAPTATTTASANGFWFDGIFTIRTIGASGTATGRFMVMGSNSQPFTTGPSYVSEDTGTIAVDTTGALILELTCVTAAGTTTVTWREAAIELITT